MSPSLYFIQPQSPPVFRSGRPFGAADAGGGGAGYDFPLPSAVAGAMRGAWVDAVRHTVQAQDQTLLRLHVGGGLRAVRLGGTITLHAPMPADVVYGPGKTGTGLALHRAAPEPARDAEGSNLPRGLQSVRCRLRTKPVPGPTYWSLTAWTDWMDGRSTGLTGGHSLAAVPHDLRQHVVIDSGTLTNVQGGLFESDGLDFDLVGKDHGIVAWLGTHSGPNQTEMEGPGGNQQLNTAALAGRSVRLGADGRTALFEHVPDDQVDHWTCPDGLHQAVDALKVGDCFRLALLTPACFLRNGWYPDGFKPVEVDDPNSPIEGSLTPLLARGEHKDAGWHLRLRAAAVNRWQPWAASSTRDDAGQGKFVRRPLRRLVPAGSVYWLEIVRKGTTPLSQLWMKSICRTDCSRDGFGLAIPGLHIDLPNQ